LCEMMASSKEPPKVQPSLLRIVDGGKTVSAAIQINPPQQNIVLTFSNEAQLNVLATYLKKQDFKFQGVVGPAQESEMFSDLWVEMSSKSKKLAMGQKIYKADMCIQPKNVTGKLKIANENELNIVTQYFVDFAEESLPLSERKSFDEIKIMTSKKLTDKWIYLWMVDGTSVSVAHIGRPTKNGISVSGVFTPRQFRKRGYASAVTAGVTQAMLDSGKKFCVLYTDLSNPTSNKIYQDVGYREVAASKYFSFE
jgi:predicted GNAT family acetyltransferase